MTLMLSIYINRPYLQLSGFSYNKSTGFRKDNLCMVIKFLTCSPLEKFTNSREVIHTQTNVILTYFDIGTVIASVWRNEHGKTRLKSTLTVSHISQLIKCIDCAAEASR